MADIGREPHLTAAQETVDTFLEQSDGVWVSDMATYRRLLHESGVVTAVATLVAEHPETQVLDATTGRRALHLHVEEKRQPKAKSDGLEVFALVSGDADTGLLRVATYRLPYGVGPKEKYAFTGRQKNFGDLAVRTSLSNVEHYVAWQTSRRASSPEELTKLVDFTRTTFERFAMLIRT